MVARLEIADKSSSSSMHHSLERRQCRCRQPDQNCVAVVKSRQNECRDKTGCRILTEQTAKSTESSQVVVARAGDMSDVRSHVEFGVEVDSEIADFTGWLYCMRGMHWI